MQKILIVEDELIIAENTKIILSKNNYEVIGIAKNYNQVFDIIVQKKPELILLDIHLNDKKNGIDVANELNKNFKIPFIYTTSYSDTNTLDEAKITSPLNYLVKPFTEEQLISIIKISTFNLIKNIEVKDSIEVTKSNFKNEEFIFVKEKLDLIKIKISDIKWIRSDGNYLEVYCNEKFKLIRATISSFYESLPENFIRIHNSYIINMNFLEVIQSSYVIINNNKIPISKNYKADFLKKINVL
ncbi:response regulator transcription factor [Flavobacterium piscinae]|uniref:Response regulator transcription factor n=1 Tax=Flavobacterium piscinae TaxID=2506424 RepID=A0A4V1N4S2_9FLAO|nr:response regulator [Flavobacterium piscinae]RXR33156.1 response regulator transcription factor [Flavobacterium piscinae]